MKFEYTFQISYTFPEPEAFLSCKKYGFVIAETLIAANEKATEKYPGATEYKPINKVPVK